MYGTDSGTQVKNRKDIKLLKENSTGIFAKDDAVAENESNGNIEIAEKNSVGMFGLASSTSKKINLTNTGTITLKGKEEPLLSFPHFLLPR